jgi:hypothetical protein
LPREHNLQLVGTVVAALAEVGCETWIFGEWAEEINGLCPPRGHGDIDLLLPATSFHQLDALLDGGVFSEIVTKRFPHKRALKYDDVMVELFLVQRDTLGPHTNFWGCVRHDWPSNPCTDRLGLRIATPEALRGYIPSPPSATAPTAGRLAGSGEAPTAGTLVA